MKLQILSDTHNSEYHLAKEADVIIHAGDFSNHLSGVIDFTESCKRLNKNFIFVLGNHDYYDSNYNQVVDFLKDNFPNNALIDNNCIKIEDKHLLGGLCLQTFVPILPSQHHQCLRIIKKMLNNRFMTFTKS
ncbi:metallophosphoesterase [Acinetobacter sp. ANC 7454]|uniref:metallophosphoesterase family protein n=1 Tax=Acinetobacter thermotolerans TaxID=3151487 RepID=UPI00325BAC6A